MRYRSSTSGREGAPQVQSSQLRRSSTDLQNVPLWLRHGVSQVQDVPDGNWPTGWLHGSQFADERRCQHEFRLAAEQPTSSSYAESCEQRSDAHDSCQRSRPEETRRATVIGEVVAGRTEGAQPSRGSSTDPRTPWPVSQADGPEPTTVPKRYSTRCPTLHQGTACPFSRRKTLSSFSNSLLKG